MAEKLDTPNTIWKGWNKIVLRKLNLIGQRFGYLVVIEEAEPHFTPQGQKSIRWLCRCDCGNLKECSGSDLRRGAVKSCGCFTYELLKESKKHLNHNQYNIKDYEYGIGYTNKGDIFIFDKEDYELLKQYCWTKTKEGYLSAKTLDRSGKHILMHNLILNQTHIDHINRKRYDNRKINLRISPSDKSFDSINQMNKMIQSNNTSGYTGITFHKRDKIWETYISVNKKRIYLGRFNNLEDAIKKRKEAEKEYFGEYSFDESFNYSKQYEVEV